MDGATLQADLPTGTAVWEGGVMLAGGINSVAYLQSTGPGGLTIATNGIGGVGDLVVDQGRVALTTANSYAGWTYVVGQGSGIKKGDKGADFTRLDILHASALERSVGTDVSRNGTLALMRGVTIASQPLYLNGGTLLSDTGSNRWDGPIFLQPQLKDGINTISVSPGTPTFVIGGAISSTQPTLSKGIPLLLTITAGDSMVVLKGNYDNAGRTDVLTGTLSIAGGLTYRGSDYFALAAPADGTFSGAARLETQVGPIATFAGIGSTIIPEFGDAMPKNYEPTTANILAGINTGDAQMVAMQWRMRGESDTTLVSDVLRLTGMTSGDPFVLEMSYQDGWLTLDGLAEFELAASGNLFLGWFDDVEWVNAVAGNSGGTAKFVLGAWQDFGEAGLGDDLGRWGVDTERNTVWAVLNHNSDFASMQFNPQAVPEPSSLVLLGLTSAAAYWRWRRRACAVGPPTAA